MNKVLTAAFLTISLLVFSLIASSIVHASCSMTTDPCADPEPFACHAGFINFCCSESNSECQDAMGSGGCSGGEINTAIGCIPVTDMTDFTTTILRWLIGIAGGISLVLIIYSGFTITISSGDPYKIKAGKELLTAAIAGLLLAIFSVFLLRFIGIDILNIPGLELH